MEINIKDKCLEVICKVPELTIGKMVINIKDLSWTIKYVALEKWLLITEIYIKDNF